MTASMFVVNAKGQFVLTSLGNLPLVILTPHATRLVSTRNSWLSAGFDVAALKMVEFSVSSADLIVGFTDGICGNSRELKHLLKKWEGRTEMSLADLEGDLASRVNEEDDVSLLMVKRRAS